MQYVPKDLWNDKQFLLEVVKYANYSIINYLPKEFENDKEFLLQAIKLNSLSLVVPIKDDHCYQNFRFRFQENGIQCDKKLMIEAVKNNGYALKYVAKELKKDEELVMEALKCNGFVLKYSDEYY